MACDPVGINQDNESCDVSDGGIYQSYVTDFANITSATFDASGQITAIVMSGSGQWVKYVYDDDDTAFFNSEGERTGKKHVYNQSAFMKFEGITVAKIADVNAVVACCAGVWIHFLNSGIAIFQGLEDDGTGAIKRTKQTAKATGNVVSDTGENTDRVELTINSQCKTVHPTSLTAAAIEAL